MDVDRDPPGIASTWSPRAVAANNIGQLRPADPAARTLLALLRGQDHTGDAAADEIALAGLAARLWLEPRLAVRAAGNRRVPPAIHQRWRDARCATAARNMLFQREEENLLRALQRAGVEAVPLKGTSLARLLGDLASRPVTDIDLAIRAQDVARAGEALQRLGYAIRLPAALLSHRRFLAGTDAHTSEVTCSREEAGTVLALELHWKCLSLPEEEVWRGVQTYSPSGVRTLGLEHYFLFLCAHAADGGWAGLRWLCDLAEFLAMLGHRLDAARCVQLAGRAGLRRAVGVTLELLDAFFDVRHGGLEPLRDTHSRRLAHYFCRRPFQPFLQGTPASIHRDRLRVQDSAARRAAYLARLLRPTFQEWADSQGQLRPVLSAWALRFTRLAGQTLAAARPASRTEARS